MIGNESLAVPLTASVPQPLIGKSLGDVATHQNGEIVLVVPSFVPTNPTELVASISSGCHLQVLYRYTRSPHLYSSSMVNIELSFVNTGTEELTDIKISNKVGNFRVIIKT